MPSRRRVLAALPALALPALAGLPVRASAQDRYPSRPVTLVVPFAAGGGPDIYARKFVQRLAPVLGQSVVIDNRPGANSMIGTSYVAKARPDGYTLLYASSSSLSAAPGMFKNLPYDPIKDFAGITMVHQSYFALLIRAEDPPITLAQFAERMKADPIRHPVAGASSTQEIINKQLQRALKTDTTYVRYANASQMMTDLLGGRLGLVVSPLAQALPFVASGKTLALAVTSPARLRAAPTIPTLAESYPGFVQDTWTGLFAPAGTAREVIATLNRAAHKVFDDPEIRQISDENGRQFRTTPDETDVFVRKEVPRWTELLKAAGIEPG